MHRIRKYYKAEECRATPWTERPRIEWDGYLQKLLWHLLSTPFSTHGCFSWAEEVRWRRWPVKTKKAESFCYDFLIIISDPSLMLCWASEYYYLTQYWFFFKLLLLFPHYFLSLTVRGIQISFLIGDMGMFNC